MRHVLTRIAGIGLMAISLSAHAAGRYPERPITLIVPFSAGSGSDTQARILSESLSGQLGVPIVVENKPGANGTIGASFVARAKPDGYTFLLGSATTNAANLSLYPSKRTGFDESSFVMVGVLSRGIIGMFVPSNFSWKSVDEFLAAVKSGKAPNLTCGSGNSVTQVACEMFKVTAGVDAVTVPYKSNGQSLNDVAGGRVSYAFSDRTAALPYMNGKLVHLKAVSSDTRYETLPDVPTLAEQGVPDMLFSSWTGVFAPAGTAPEIVHKVNEAINTWLRSPSAASLFEKTGASFQETSVDESAVFYHAEASRWENYIEKTKVSVN